VIDAATGIGMSRGQRLRWVLLPLAAPFLFAGIRTAAVIATGSATLAAFIGAGGLGEAIISGLSVQNYGEVLSGAIPAAVLALSFDAGFAALQWWSRPEGANA
jgi:osmoprotectant transport system permease protein